MIVMYLKMMPECLAHLNFYSCGMHTDKACLVSAEFFPCGVLSLFYKMPAHTRHINNVQFPSIRHVGNIADTDTKFFR